MSLLGGIWGMYLIGCIRIVWLVSVVDGAYSELQCGCLNLGCNCVGVEHEAIGEGGALTFFRLYFLRSKSGFTSCRG